MQQNRNEPIVMANSQEISLREFKPHYSQVVYQGGQVVQPNELNKENQNQELGQKVNQSPLIEKEITFRNLFSKFAVTNAVFGIYYLIILIFSAALFITVDDLSGILMLIFIYTSWGVSFYMVLKTFKTEQPSHLYAFQIVIFILGIVETYLQSQIFTALNDSSIFLKICFFAFWIISLILLALLLIKCKQLRKLTIEIQYLKLEQLQQSEV